jgi:magnesium chelatase subunit D
VVNIFTDGNTAKEFARPVLTEEEYRSDSFEEEEEEYAKEMAPEENEEDKAEPEPEVPQEFMFEAESVGMEDDMMKFGGRQKAGKGGKSGD